VDAYFSIYADSLRRWGDGAIGFYPRRLFREMLGMPEFGQAFSFNSRAWTAW